MGRFSSWLLLIALVSCMADERIYTHCVPNSILSAWTWGAMKKQPVRIAISKIGEGVDHSQAQALIDGKWTPLTEQWKPDVGRMEIVPWTPHFAVEPYRYSSLDDWIAEQIPFTRAPEEKPTIESIIGAK